MAIPIIPISLLPPKPAGVGVAGALIPATIGAVTYHVTPDQLFSGGGTRVVDSDATGDAQPTVELAWNAQANATFYARETGEITFYRWPSGGPGIYRYMGNQMVGPWATGAADWLNVTIITSHGALTGLGADDHLQYLPLTGVRAMTGPLTLPGAPTLPLQAATKGYVDGRFTGLSHGTLTGLAADDHLQYLPLTGARPMTGALTLSGAPTLPLHAATKGYVDAADAVLQGNINNVYNGTLTALALKVDKAGDVMSGPLTLPGFPTVPLHAATKGYVDAAIGGIGPSLPPGGATGEVLTKLSPASGDADWEPAAGGGAADIADAQPALNEGEQWFESDTGVFYLRYRNPDGTFTLVATNTPAAGSVSVGYVDAADALRVLKAGDTMTGPLTVPKLFAGDGTVAAPGIAFTSEPGLGIVRQSAGVLGVTAGGAVRLNISAAAFQVAPPATMQSTLLVTGALSAATTLGVGGAATFNGASTFQSTVTLNGTGTALNVAAGNIVCAGTISSPQGTFTNLNATNNLGVGNGLAVGGTSILSGTLTVNGAGVAALNVAGGSAVIAGQMQVATLVCIGSHAGTAYPVGVDCNVLSNIALITSGASQWPSGFYHHMRHAGGTYSPAVYSFTPINITVSLGWHTFSGFYTNHAAETSMSLRIGGPNGVGYSGLGVGLYPIYNNADFGGKIDWEYGVASPATAVMRLSAARGGSYQQIGDISIQTNGYTTNTAQVVFNCPSATQAASAEYSSIVVQAVGGDASIGFKNNAGGNHILSNSSNLYFAVQGAGGAHGTWLGALQSNSYWICAGYQTASSRDWKTNIRPIANALRDLLAIPGLRFYNKFLGRDDLGLTTQDVEPVFPELVSHVLAAGATEPTSVLNYQGLIAPMIEAIRELTARVAALEAA